MQNLQTDINTHKNKVSLLSIGRASEYLGVSIDTLRRWERKGKIEAHRSPGGHRYFRKNDLDDLFGTKYERELSEEKPSEDSEDKEEKIDFERPKKLNGDAVKESPLSKPLELFDPKYAEEKILTRSVREISIPSTRPILIRQSITHLQNQTQTQINLESENQTQAPSILIPQTQVQAQTSQPQQIPPFPPKEAPVENKKQATYNQNAKETKKEKALLTGSQKMIIIVILVSIFICFAALLYFLPQPEILSPIPD